MRLAINIYIFSINEQNLNTMYTPTKFDYTFILRVLHSILDLKTYIVINGLFSARIRGTDLLFIFLYLDFSGSTSCSLSLKR